MEIITVIELGKYVANTPIVYIFINNIYYKTELYLVIFFSINKMIKIDLYGIILHFDLVIYLRVESYSWLLLNVTNII